MCALKVVEKYADVYCVKALDELKKSMRQIAHEL